MTCLTGNKENVRGAERENDEYMEAGDNEQHRETGMNEGLSGG